MAFLKEGIRRRVNNDKEVEGSKVVHRVINILMEKPMTTDVHEAQKLWEMSAKGYPEGECVEKRGFNNLLSFVMLWCMISHANIIYRRIHY